MPATVIVGAQWGDEGKGKIVDLLAQHSDVVCRYNGGPNAGHTILVGDESPDKGLAEVHLAKHRNGPTDTLKLSFMRRFAKFADSGPT